MARVVATSYGFPRVVGSSPTYPKYLPYTEKPVELTDILVSNSSNEGDTVLDPFMGIGGCGVSCEKLGRKFIGVELDERYYEIAKNRIQDMVVNN